MHHVVIFGVGTFDDGVVDQRIRAAIGKIDVIAARADADATDERIVRQRVHICTTFELMPHLGVFENAVGGRHRGDIADIHIVRVARSIVVRAAIIVEHAVLDGDRFAAGIGQQAVLVAVEFIVDKREISVVETNARAVMSIGIWDMHALEIKTLDGQIGFDGQQAFPVGRRLGGDHVDPAADRDHGDRRVHHREIVRIRPGVDQDHIAVPRRRHGRPDRLILLPLGRRSERWRSPRRRAARRGSIRCQRSPPPGASMAPPARPNRQPMPSRAKRRAWAGA